VFLRLAVTAHAQYKGVCRFHPACSLLHSRVFGMFRRAADNLEMGLYYRAL
jgi:hypothetical protein